MRSGLTKALGNKAKMIAKQQARLSAEAFLLRDVELELCSEAPFGLYGVDLDKEFLFAVHRSHRIGSTEYIAVSKAMGTARLAGEVGE